MLNEMLRDEDVEWVDVESIQEAQMVTKYPFEAKRTKFGVAVSMPDNCGHPQIYRPLNCKSIHMSHPECDCRWCVFNKEYQQADVTTWDRIK